MNSNSKPTPQPYWRKSNSLHFSIGLILSLMLVTTAFEWNFRNELTDQPINNLRTDPSSVIDLVVVDEPVPAKPKVPSYVPPIEFENPKEIEDDPKPVELIAEPDPIEIPNLTDIFGSEDMKEEKVDEAVYELIPAQPKEGMEAFYQYLYKNISYPSHLASRNLSGKVHVKFEVDQNGKIVNVEIIKGFDKALEKELIRVLKNAPAWDAAQMGMKKVKTIHRIPFSFDIQ